MPRAPLGRNLGDVLDKLKELMPSRYHRGLDSMLETLRYRAPERERDSWAEVQYWLLSELGVDKPPLKIAKGEEWMVVEAYASVEAALKGHDKWKELAQNDELPAVIADCCNANCASFLAGLSDNAEELGLVYRRTHKSEAAEAVQ